MSFVKVAAVRAIKVNGKSYRSAHYAALAYADAATRQFYYNYARGLVPSGMTIEQWTDWSGPIREKFYRRSHKIFTRYFNGG